MADTVESLLEVECGYPYRMLPFFCLFDQCGDCVEVVSCTVAASKASLVGRLVLVEHWFEAVIRVVAQNFCRVGMMLIGR